MAGKNNFNGLIIIIEWHDSIPSHHSHLYFNECIHLPSWPETQIFFTISMVLKKNMSDEIPIKSIKTKKRTVRNKMNTKSDNHTVYTQCAKNRSTNCFFFFSLDISRVPSTISYDEWVYTIDFDDIMKTKRHASFWAMESLVR